MTVMKWLLSKATAEALIVFLALSYIKAISFAFKYGNKHLKEKYALLLSIIKGRIYFKYGKKTVIENRGIRLQLRTQPNVINVKTLIDIKLAN
jgi:hypothetical protein